MRPIVFAFLVLIATPTFASRIPGPERRSRDNAAADAQLSPRRVDPPKASEKPDPRTLSGRRVDLDFWRTDVHTVLRALAGAGQVTIVIEKEVGGEVTVKMRDAPWEQALHIVVTTSKCDYQREGNVVRIWKKRL
jgi:type II secretory pathway component HofQ